MKNFKKIISVLVVSSSISLITIGCTQTNTVPKKDSEIPNETPKDEGKVDNVENGETESDVMKGFLKLIKPESTASELGLYIKDNIKDVSKTDADKMIEWLLIYQTEATEDFNNKIMVDDYLNILNEDLGGTLDPEKIKTIKDESKRAEYKSLVDGLMTIVRQEETPVVQTDWKQLEYYSSNTTDDLNELIKLYSKVQNYDYNREEFDAVAIGNDIVKTENILQQSNSTLIKWKGTDLYEDQLYMLLAGAEGEYIDSFKEKNDEIYEGIVKVAETHPDTKLAELIKDIDLLDVKDSMQVTDRINQTTQFGIDSNNYIETVKKDKASKEFNILNVHFEDDVKKQDQINTIIETDIDNLIKKEGVEKGYNLNAFPSFQNKRYISYNGFLDYQVGEDVKSTSFYRTLDYIEEKFVSLDEYLGVQQESLKGKLEKLTDKQFQTLPDYYITAYGVTLIWLDSEGREDYANLNYKDLMEFFTLEEFLEGKKVENK